MTTDSSKLPRVTSHFIKMLAMRAERPEIKPETYRDTLMFEAGRWSLREEIEREAGWKASELADPKTLNSSETASENSAENSTEHDSSAPTLTMPSETPEQSSDQPMTFRLLQMVKGLFSGQ